MSLIKRAREVAENAAESARDAAEAARIKAGEIGRSASDPALHERLGREAKEAVGQARRGMATVVERIDPGTLAELIIKATALQEKTNASLRDKHSPYRISEISISASIPPGISFVISRIDEGEMLSGHSVSSAELIETVLGAADAQTVISLDGATDDGTADEGPGAP